MNPRPPKIEIRGLEMAYGAYVVMREIVAAIQPGEVFVIMGGSGCGKSTLLRHLVGLKEPARGDILYDGESFTAADEAKRLQLRRRTLRFGSFAHFLFCPLFGFSL